MRTLFDLCKPRQSVFDENKRDDVLHLMNLIKEIYANAPVVSALSRKASSPMGGLN